ncbi:AMP-binding protein [Sphingomonas tabacisoli]|uniref:AMP-binding protein n=1 Tax=Sphingomonas tabacisoli TaxID=2249466 RepID=A0ABW4I5K0_9SPHN
MPGFHPSAHALNRPDHPAFVLADAGEELTYRQLDQGSNRIAHLFRSRGLRPGDRVAVMVSNSIEFPQLYWGATRAGLIVTLLSTHLKAPEASYIIRDSGAVALVVSTALGETPEALLKERGEAIPAVRDIFCVGEALAGAEPLTEAAIGFPAEPIADQISGFHMIYSSGTTGRPKGVVMPYTPGPIDEFQMGEGLPAMYQQFDPLVTLNAGPLYHGAPLSGMVMTQRLGGTFVTQRKFDAEGILRAIERWRVNNAQFVPTMFVRLLALPEEVRRRYDVSSLRFAVHAAAPCPIEVKRQMIDWWGPILFEYYGSTEGVGATAISSQEWLQKPGSVGKTSMGAIHICDEDGRELPVGESGLIYFEALPGRTVAYLNDPEKTRSATHPDHPDWFCIGDIGRLDEDGYLFLTDRKDFMIISGGVNIYPQAIEDCLIVHDSVLDVAVIGVPHPEFGEEVRAVVQPATGVAAGSELEAELRQWCRTRISAVTQPRSYVFVEELPRLPSGKLAKHELRKQFGAISE